MELSLTNYKSFEFLSYLKITKKCVRLLSVLNFYEKNIKTSVELNVNNYIYVIYIMQFFIYFYFLLLFFLTAIFFSHKYHLSYKWLQRDLNPQLIGW